MPKSSFRRLLRDTTGGAALVIALSAPVFVGGLGLGTEVGMWYFNQRKLQNAADNAAYAAAVERRAGRNGRMQAAAETAAVAGGFEAARGTIMVMRPPTSGAFQNDQNAVEVRVEETVPRMFTAIFGREPLALAGRAVARISDGLPTCVLALHPSASNAIQVGGSSSTTLAGCNVHSNSLAPDATFVHGNATVKTDCMSSAGGVVRQNNADLRLTSCVAIYENADVVPDPFAGLTPPSAIDNRTASGSTLLPGNYDGNVTLHGNVHLEPGVYVINGDLQINANARVTGTDVTLFIKGDKIMHINGGANVDLSAPTSGPYANVLVFADPQASGSSGKEHTINGGAGVRLDGVLYMPKGQVKINGNSTGAGHCMPVVAQTVLITGNTTLDVDCGGRIIQPIQSSRLIQLVE